MAKTKVGSMVVVKFPRASENFVLVTETEEHKRGKLNLPGGGLDEDESLIECAVRETEEESGLIVSVIGFLGTYQVIKENKIYKAVGAEVVGGQLNETSIVASRSEIEQLNQAGALRSDTRITDAIDRLIAGRMVDLGFLMVLEEDPVPQANGLIVPTGLISA